MSSKILLNSIINTDGITAIKEIDNQSIHLILSDIPYGIGIDDWDVLHNNTNSALLGSSPAQKKAGKVFKTRGKPLNGWSEADKKIPLEYQQWCSSFASEWLRVLKPGGSAIVFAGRRLSHRCIVAFEDAGFTFKDSLAWIRETAPHRAQRISVVFDKRKDETNSKLWQGWKVGNLRPKFEPILWFTKPYNIGSTLADNVINHQLGAYNEKAFLNYEKQPNNILNSGFEQNERGHHITQKPVKLLQSLIELTTIKDQIVLDPFCGSGSTLVAALSCNRQFLGFDINPQYVEIANKRIEEFNKSKETQ